MRKRSKYRPKPIRVNPIEHAIQGAAITPKAELDTLRLRELASLDALTRGHGGLTEWQDINAANNLCQTMARMGIGLEALPVCLEVEDHLIEAAARFEKTRRMLLTGPAIQTMRDMLEYHDLQRSSVARSQYEEALRLVMAHIKSGHTKHVKELI